MALIISTGFVVDDAIVVLENAVHHVERGPGTARCGPARGAGREASRWWP